MQSSKSAIVIGAGIVGLAIARSLGKRGYSVKVFERNEKAIGASIRNFGMIWPIGQPNGQQYERALKTRRIWEQVCTETGLWNEKSGSLHLAYTDLELQVMNEFVEANKGIRPVSVLTSSEALKKSNALNSKLLKGALWSEDEMIIESRVAIERLPSYLTEKYGIEFHFNTAVTNIDFPKIKTGAKNTFYVADEIYVCSGSDFETLFPEVFANHSFTKCKLQMMRFIAQPDQWRIGPSLCGGLSMIHYKGFEIADSLVKLKKYYQATKSEYLRLGIHVMASQNAEGEITIGDSHEYALVHDPFDKTFINEMIVNYLTEFTILKDTKLIQTWNGIYSKMTNGETEFVYSPEPGVHIINGLGGAGMTLSFGLAEEILEKTYS